MKQVTGNNGNRSDKAVSIQLMLDGHSFSVDALPAAGKEVPCVAELLTPRSMLVPREEFSEELAEGYLAAEGLAPQDGECVVWSNTQEQIVAVMAIDRMLLDALRAKYEAGVRFTSPLLHLPKFSGNAVWMQRNGSLLYVKVYRTILRMAEVIQVESDADVLYFVERLTGIFPAADFELHLTGADSAALRKLLKGYYKRIVCE